jgi:hypothetical protein
LPGLIIGTTIRTTPTMLATTIAGRINAGRINAGRSLGVRGRF